MKRLKLWCRAAIVLTVLIAGCPAAAAQDVSAASGRARLASP